VVVAVVVVVVVAVGRARWVKGEQMKGIFVWEFRGCECRCDDLSWVGAGRCDENGCRWRDCRRCDGHGCKDGGGHVPELKMHVETCWGKICELT